MSCQQRHSDPSAQLCTSTDPFAPRLPSVSSHTKRAGSTAIPSGWTARPRFIKQDRVYRRNAAGTCLCTAGCDSCILSLFVLVQWSHRGRHNLMVYLEGHSHVVSESKTSLPMPMQSPASRRQLQSNHVWCTGGRGGQNLVHPDEGTVGECLGHSEEPQP